MPTYRIGEHNKHANQTEENYNYDTSNKQNKRNPEMRHNANVTRMQTRVQEHVLTD